MFLLAHIFAILQFIRQFFRLLCRYWHVEIADLQVSRNSFFFKSLTVIIQITIYALYLNVSGQKASQSRARL